MEYEYEDLFITQLQLCAARAMAAFFGVQNNRRAPLEQPKNMLSTMYNVQCTNQCT